MLKKILLLILLFSHEICAAEKSIEEYINNLMNNAFAVLHDSNLPQNQKIPKVEKMLHDNLDTKWMAKFTLGRMIKTLEEKQINDFVDTYSKYIIHSYASAVSLYKGEVVKIQEVIKIDEEFSIVKTTIHKNEGSIINVDYLVITSKSGYKVCDVITEGISLINSQKAEYTNMIASQGIEHLLKELQSKLK